MELYLTSENEKKILSSLSKERDIQLMSFCLENMMRINKYFIKILNEVKNRGNTLKFILLYLSPSDYHRFHSPTLFSTNYRRHIPGNLHPVMPSYVKKHPHVFKENERVVLFGEWIKGFFTISFIGATNVGSISILFDKDLNTNDVMVVNKNFKDKNYLRMTELEGIFKNNLVIQK